MTDVLGRDLLAVYRVTDGRHEDLDLVPERHAAGIDNAVQAVIHRIKTVAGELADLGHPEYGSRHHELIGEPNTEGNRNLVKLYILQALAREPRIEKVLRADIVADPAGLAADFTEMMEAAMGKEVADVALRVWTPVGTTIKFVKQVAPTVEELTGRRVIGYHSQVVFDPMRAFEIFVLESEPRELSANGRETVAEG